MAAFHVGDVWVPVATVTNPETGEAVEPDGITFTFKSYRGVETIGTPTKVSTGVWKSSIELIEPGIWVVSVETTGAYKASQPESIPVAPRFSTN